MVRSTASLWPLTTTWPPPLSLATATTSPRAASLQASWAGSSSMPSRAAMAPTPTGTAFCIDWPRSFKSRAASASCRAPAAARAEYSPSEWPATCVARLVSGLPPSFSRMRDDRHADRHQGGLGILGQDEVGFRPFPHRLSTGSASAPRRPPGRRRVPWRRPWQGRIPCRRPGIPVPERRTHDSWADFPRFWPEAGILIPHSRRGRNALISGDLPV